MLYLSAITLAFFLSFVLLTKKQKSTGDYILVTWLALIGFHLVGFYLFFTGKYADYPALFVMSFPLPLVHGPLLYLYTMNQTTATGFKKKQLLHFLPVLISWCLFARYFMLSESQQLEVIRNNGKGFEIQMGVNLYAAWISGITYVSLSLYQLRRYKRKLVHQFSNTEKINFNWLLYLVVWMVAIWLSVIVMRNDIITFSAVAIFVGWIAYFGIKQVQVFSQRTTEVNEEPVEAEETSQSIKLTEAPVQLKYTRSALSEQDAINIHQRLNTLLQEQQPYKDPDLTLTDLARSLDIHPNTLSQVINSRENKSFYDLINEKRVKEFIRLSAQPMSQQYTLLSLAYDCGFNSKASFNRNFKKHAGTTPSDYVKQQTPLPEVSSPL